MKKEEKRNDTHEGSKRKAKKRKSIVHSERPAKKDLHDMHYETL